MSPSLPCCPVATPATTMLWASIILAITPPLEFAAVVRTGLSPASWAGLCWGWPTRALMGGGVAAGQGPAEPAEQGREEGEQSPGGGECQSHGGVEPGEAAGVGDGQ